MKGVRNKATLTPWSLIYVFRYENETTKNVSQTVWKRNSTHVYCFVATLTPWSHLHILSRQTVCWYLKHHK